jgi:hypothetical protein
MPTIRAAPDLAAEAGHEGVVFPVGPDGRRGTTAVGKSVLAEAVAASSAQVAAAIEGERDWRHAYPVHVRHLVELGAAGAEVAQGIAISGLAALHKRFEYVQHGRAMLLREAMAAFTAKSFQTVTIEGTGGGTPELVVPYRGKRLVGDELRRQIDRWVDAAVVEPSFATAIGAVLDHPEWLDLADLHVAILGAGAELGPFPILSRWRANVAVVDVPGRAAWRSILVTARAGNGRVLVPVRETCSATDPQLAGKAGADLLTDTPEIRTWLADLPGPLAVGCYAYLDGEAHVRVAMAMDAVVADLLAKRPDVMPAYLLTPTDVYAVPAEAAEAAVQRWQSRGTARWLQDPLRWASGNRLFTPNISEIAEGAGGWRAATVDSLVIQQGANYMLAKRLQQWRATAARLAGARVSAKIAPATRTRSVVKSRALAAAYNGAHHFGVEIFEPDCANALMAALLVHDLRTATGCAAPSVRLANPLALFVEAAAHGGLWRMAYAPRSVLPLAAILGLF